jgi:hypothetical protein
MLEYLLASGTAAVEGPFIPPTVESGKAFKGWVSSAALIDGDALATAIGLSAGTSHNADAGWLHYIDGAREFYIARKTFRYGLGHAPIEAAISNGTKVIQIGADYYKVKQISAMAADPFSSIVGVGGGGDWDKYIYPLVTGPARAQITAEVWSYYTEKDLGLSPNWGTQPNGSITHAADKHSALTTARASRGRNYGGGTSIASVVGRTVYYSDNPNEGNAGTGLNQYGWRPMLEKTTAPPPPDVFYGEVASGSFITPGALTTAVGMGAVGSVTNIDTVWLKYKIAGKTLYTPKLPLRHGITWDALNALGIVYGTKVIVIGGKRYSVRLPKGVDPAVPSANVYNPLHMGGDFNSMIYPVYGGVALNNALVQAYPRWAAYTDAELGLSVSKSGIPNGALTMCQEMTANGGYLVRGYNDNDNAGTAQIIAGWYVGGSVVQAYAGWRPVLEELPDLVESFMGEVSAANFITNSALTTAVGVTMGTQINASEGWLHYYVDNTEYYLAKKPFRQSLTREHLHSLGAAVGTKTVTIGGNVYKVRLMLCKDPAAAKPGQEWAKFIYRVYGGSTASHPDVQAQPRWAAYTDAELGLGNESPADGHINIGQDAYNGGWASPGYHSPTELWYQPANTTNEGYGWRPLLELVP